MNTLIQFLAAHGLMLLLGATALLAIGSIGLLCHRSPLHRQRLGEMTVVAVVVWLLLASVPLPRLEWPAATPSTRAAGVEAHGPLPAAPTGQMFATAASAAPPASPAELAELSQALTTTTTTPADTASSGLIEAPATPSPDDAAVDPAPRRPIDWASILPVTYLAGAAACTAWLLLGHLLLFRLVRGAAPPAPWLARVLAEVGDGNARAARLLVSAAASRPISCGILRPTILLPAHCSTPAKARQVRQVLLHELAHIRQRDAIGHLLLNLALPVLFFHPFYWFIRARVFLARELVADDRAAAAGTKESYVTELIALAAADRSARFAAPVAVIGIFESTSHFYRRMHMLLRRESPLPTRCSKLWRCTNLALCALLLAGSTLVVGVRPAAAQVVAPPAADRDDAEQLRRQRDELAARLAEMEKRFNQLQAKLDAMSLDAQARYQAAMAKQQSDMAEAALRRQREYDRAYSSQKDAGANLATATTRPTSTDAGEQQAKSRNSGDSVDRSAAAPADDRRSGRRSTTDPAAATISGVSLPKGGLDLVRLAETYLEAVGNAKLTRYEHGRVKQMHERKVAADSELEVAQVRLEMAMRKLQLFQAMIESALKAADTEYALTKQRFETGLVSQSELHEAESKRDMLRLILGSGN